MTRVTAFLGLGGNLGQPDKTIEQALKLLRQHAQVEVMMVSPFYRTEPMGMAIAEGQVIPWFVNAVAQVETSLSPETLLDLCLSIEHQLGRERPGSLAQVGASSRTLDLDILFYGEQVIHRPGLTIPHPRLHERAFTLFPLRDIAPHYCHPALLQTIEALCLKLPTSQGIQLLESPELVSA